MTNNNILNEIIADNQTAVEFNGESYRKEYMCILDDYYDWKMIQIYSLIGCINVLTRIT